MNKKAILFHIDFDSYFVSAMRTVKPKLKNKPVICAKNSNHAIATSISYELKNLGIKAGTKIADILKVVPNAIIVQPNYELFSILSNDIFSYLAAKYSNKIKVCSIDECFLDVSNKCQTKEQAINLARKIQQDILKRFDIPITIGISNTFFASKMTTNISKPFGIGYTDVSNFAEHFFELPIDEFHGIGKNLAPKLKEIGIFKIGDLAKYDRSNTQLQAILGHTIVDVLDCLNIDKNEFISKSNKEVKGIGKSETFAVLPVSQELIEITLDKFLEDVYTRMMLKNLACKTVSVGIRELNQEWKWTQFNFAKYSTDFKIIKKTVYMLYCDNFNEISIKGIGVRLSNLESVFELYEPISLFEETPNQITDVDRIMNQINKKFNQKKAITLKEYSQKQKQTHNNSPYLDGVVFKKW
ncbi:Y-family DNA polymerase [Mycoplasma hafezii]|uniref:Y-family DNA polymerase n=1 Tax=Mycoplasma hafezii TaxID=525886 RepID=UPI003CEDDD01